MKVLQAQQHGDKAWSNEELLNFKFIIYSNVITQMKQIIQAAEQLNIPLEGEHTVILIMDISNKQKKKTLNCLLGSYLFISG